MTDNTPDQSDTELTTEPTPDDTTPDDTEDSPTKRETRYRLQLRETEAERDQLRGNVETLQRAEVERLAAKLIQKPGALWSADIELSDLLDDAGNIDADKVDAAVTSARDTLGLAATRPPGYVSAEGHNPGPPAAPNKWEDAFKL